MKRKMICIVFLSLMVLCALSFSACGGGGSSEADGAPGLESQSTDSIEYPCNLNWNDTQAVVEEKLNNSNTNLLEGYVSTSFMGYDYWYAMPEYEGGDLEKIEVWALWLSNDYNELPHPDWEDIVSRCTELYGEPDVSLEADYEWEVDGVKIVVSWNTMYENGNIAYTKVAH